MSRSSARYGILLLVLVALAAVSVLPCEATYDKAYRFRNRTGTPQCGVFVVLNALEVIKGQYTGDLNPWGPGAPGTMVIGGVYCTTLTWDEDPDVCVPGDGGADSVVKIGWNTADHDCRLRSLNWGDSAAGAPIDDPFESGAVPGGGSLAKEGGTWVWSIMNDTSRDLRLANVEFDTFSEALDQNDLLQIAENGAVGKRLSLLVDAATGADKTDARAARDENAAGRAQFAEGNAQQARPRWASALSKLTDISNRGRLGPAWRGRVQRMMALLRRQEPPREDPPPGWARSRRIPQGGAAEIRIPPGLAKAGDSVILHGTYVNAAGQVVLDWVDRVELY